MPRGFATAARYRQCCAVASYGMSIKGARLTSFFHFLPFHFHHSPAFTFSFTLMSTFRTSSAFSHLENYLSLVELDCGLNWGDLSHLHRWTSHDINWSFLSGIVALWDPEDHVIRLGLDELCPTIEEFSVLMRQDVSLPLASLEIVGALERC